MSNTKQNNAAGIVIMVLIAAGIAVACVSGIINSDSGGDTNASPLPSDKQATSIAADLADATKAQGICYGWDVDFDDNWSYKGGESQGSNQGAGQPLDTSQCDRWVVFRGSVTWTSSSSESNDYGDLGLDSSANLTNALPDDDQQKAAGIDVDSLIDWPRDAIETAMSALPLLMSENGAAPALPAGNDSSAAAEVSPPPAAGNDNLRAHKASLILGLIGIVGALALLTAGLVIWRRNRTYAGVADIAPVSPAPSGSGGPPAPPRSRGRHNDPGGHGTGQPGATRARPAPGARRPGQPPRADEPGHRPPQAGGSEPTKRMPRPPEAGTGDGPSGEAVARASDEATPPETPSPNPPGSSEKRPPDAPPSDPWADPPSSTGQSS